MHKIKTRTKIVIAVVLAAAIIVPLLLQDNRYFMDVFIIIGIYIILGSAMNLLIGYTRQVSLGMAGFYGIGAYTSVLMKMNFNLPFLVNMVIAVTLCFFVGFILGLPSTKLNFIFLGLSTGGLNTIIYLIINNSSFTGGASGIKNIPAVTLFGEKMTKIQYYFMVLFFVLLVLYICYRIIYSKTGRALQSIRDNPIAASAVGINVNFYKLLVFAITASFAGIAGTLYAFNIRFIQADTFSVNVSFKLLTMGVIGGMGDASGGVIGALVAGALPEFLRDLNKYQPLLYSFLTIMILRFMPQGIVYPLRLLLNKIENWLISLRNKRKGISSETAAHDDDGKE